MIIMLPPRMKEIIRFGITGATATVVLYGVYLIMLRYLAPAAAYTCAYLAAFAVNYILTTSFTFKVRKSMRNGIGFIISNIINYFVSMLLLKFFLWAGVPEAVAPAPTILLATISNYLITRLVMTRL